MSPIIMGKIVYYILISVTLFDHLQFQKHMDFSNT